MRASRTRRLLRAARLGTFSRLPLPTNRGQRLGLVGALWVIVGLVLALGGLGWQAANTGEATVIHAPFLFAALLFATTSFGLRTLRWHTFLAAADVHPALATSLRTQLIGFALTMTPGKVGEFYKAYLMERATGAPTARMTPIVIFEKLMDGLAFTGLAVLAGATLPDVADTLSTATRSLLVLGAVGFLSILIFRLTSPATLENIVVRGLAFLPITRKLTGFVSVALRGGYQIARPRLLAQNMAITFAARSCDGLAMMWVAAALGISLSPIAGIFVLNSAGALGGFSMLPGGIGVVEAVMSVILVSFGSSAGNAIVATLVARVLSLWLWVAIGLGLLIRSSVDSSVADLPLGHTPEIAPGHTRETGLARTPDGTQ